MAQGEKSATHPTIKVLVVDDNKSYRDAFRRNLMMQGYEVCEAENADEALATIQAEQPHVLITDLQMRTHTEGLDLIRQVRAASPLLPVIMISAVGTFEEGAEASRLGAVAVIHKSRIEEEIDDLYGHIDEAFETLRRNAFALAETREIRAREQSPLTPDERERLQEIMTAGDLEQFVRSEAFDTLQLLTEEENQQAAAQTMAEIMPRERAEAMLAEVEAVIREELPSYDRLQGDSRESLLNAEFLFQQQSALEGNIDFSRNIGFSYCFAVENEAKARLRKRLTKFLNSKNTPMYIDEMLNPKKNGLNLFFHQHLLHAQKGHRLEITIDNVKQTLQRMIQHGPRYKPDGLKALGIMVFCFAREYEIIGNQRQRLLIQNPLGLKGLNDNEEIVTFCELLISLQHYRNPYIHPEINDMAKLSKIRDTAYVCLRMIAKLV